MGTIVRDCKDGEIIADMVKPEEKVLIAKGGIGGRGNSRFVSSTRQVPKFAEQGREGEEFEVILELKLIADVGLIGFPNVGKSTILSVMTLAKPKIGDYQFTTLEPNLGVAKLENGVDFVIADIPGLIEGAHAGIGLGHEFLRHIERTKVLIHVVDCSQTEGRDVIKDFNTINEELRLYNEKLVNKVQVIAANKMDIPGSEENFTRLKEEVNKKGYEIFPISAASKKGLRELFNRVSVLISQIKPEETLLVKKHEELVEEEEWKVRKENKIYIVEGILIERVMKNINFDDYESMQYFQRFLDKKGINKKLIEMGIEEGDTVRIGNTEFEYIE
jgi:GTP-binding protein